MTGWPRVFAGEEAVPVRRGAGRRAWWRTSRFAAAIAVTLALAGCGGGASAPERADGPAVGTAEEVVTFLKDRGLPVGEIVVYDAATDPNKLLGRPGGYASKVNFQDTRLSGTAGDFDKENGGSVEFFDSRNTALDRQEAINRVGRAAATTTEYNYVNGPVLLRLSNRLARDQARGYEDAFKTLRAR